jgi:predicted PurR-regulated permease PerM
MAYARWAIFVAIVAGIAYACGAILRPFAGVLAWSIVLAIVCFPLRDRLVRRTGSVAWSAFITSALTVMALVVPLLLLAGVAVNQSIEVGRWLQDALVHRDEQLTRAATMLARVTRPFGLDDAAMVAWVEQQVAAIASSAGARTLSFASDLFGGLVSSALVVFATFLLLRDGANLVAAIPELLPFERSRSEALLHRIKDVVQASVYGVVVIALVQGALCGAMFAILRLPSAALWGAVTVFASVLPVVGAFAVWGPATAFLAVTGHWWQAVVLAIWGAFVVSGIDNILRPRLVAGRVGLNELTTFFALLGGLAVFGGVGIVLGPVAFATGAAMLEELRAAKE